MTATVEESPFRTVELGGTNLANTHPYISGAGSVTTMIQQLRKSFPTTVDSETVKKLGLAPNNESFVINALKFIGVLGEDGKRNADAQKIFALHKDADFQTQFGTLIKQAYSDLFALHGDDAWLLDKDDLITYFRSADNTSAIIGGRQATLFRAFAALSGYGEVKPSDKPAVRKPRQAKVKESAVTKAPQVPQGGDTNGQQSHGDGAISLNVKIEVNIPSDASPEAYDAIFSSIRKHLLNG